MATNNVGQTTAAIADTEAQYADFWAQDTAARAGYSASSTAATQLPRFASANNSTNEAGVTAQNAAVTAANANAAAAVRACMAVCLVCSAVARSQVR
ncbi:PPE domain-containing protein [Mycobacterium avium]|uniref:PPE domain-containing protein n=1 Tax=Mycobacterium avium TaxID=1764 RepID=UPI001F4312C6|nr:PPE domain-containing protein [Mycobacterium avium]